MTRWIKSDHVRFHHGPLEVVAGWDRPFLHRIIIRLADALYRLAGSK